MTLQQPASHAAATAAGALIVHHTAYGCLKATGEDALDLLNRLSTNKVDHLSPGHWAPTVLTTDRGRIVDLLCVVHAGECVYLLTSPGQQQPVIEWLDKYTIMEDLEVEDVSDSTAIVALAGDGAAAALGLDALEPNYLPSRQYPAPAVNVGGWDAIAVSRPLGTASPAVCWSCPAKLRRPLSPRWPMPGLSQPTQTDGRLCESTAERQLTALRWVSRTTRWRPG